jgi:hypothetical protein
MAIYARRPTSYSPRDGGAIDEIECRLRSGIPPTLEEGQRLVATVRELWREMRQMGSRVDAWIAAGCPPGVFTAQVISRVPDVPDEIGRSR